MNVDRWSSRISFILAATSAGVGLGTIWKFPYLAGENGGGIFVLTSSITIALIGVPIFIAEVLLGRLGRQNPVAAMKNLALKANKSSFWFMLGWWGALAQVLVLSFYSVVGGWSIAYIVKLISGSLNNLSIESSKDVWLQFLSSPLDLLLCHSVFMLLTMAIVSQNVRVGIEKATKIMMPCLLLIMFVLLIYNFYIGDFKQAITFLLKPEFSKVTPKLLLDSLGQAAFSLAIGVGSMFMYGCYAPEDTKIVPNAFIVSTCIIVVSILAGFTVFPLVFAFDLSPEEGPGLMFKVLPVAFSQMPFGILVGGLFFTMLSFAGITSSVCMAEPLVVIFKEEFNLSRKVSALIIGVFCWALGILALLSFNLFSEVKFFGGYNFFDIMVDFSTNIILPTGALGFAIFAGWLLDKKIAYQALGGCRHDVFKVWRFLLRYLIPVAIVVIIFC